MAATRSIRNGSVTGFTLAVIGVNTDYMGCIWLDNIKLSSVKENTIVDTEQFGFDFEDVWVIDEDCVYPYPQLKNNNQTNDVRAEKIELKTLPKTEYYINDNISADGGVLVVTLVDGTVLEVPLSEAELSETILTIPKTSRPKPTTVRPSTAPERKAS